MSIQPSIFFFFFPKVFIDFISVSLSSESVSAELCGGATEARPTVVALQRLGEMVGGGGGQAGHSWQTREVKAASNRSQNSRLMSLSGAR